MSIDPSSGLVSWTPDSDGDFPVTVRVEDARGGFDTQAYTIAVNAPPVLDPIGDQTATIGQALVLELGATDPEGDPLAFDVVPLPLPENATFDVATATFTFVPDSNQAGVYTLTFRVSDGTLMDEETVDITVPAPDPGAPTSFTGRVLDANDYAADGTVTPIVGAEIAFLGAAGSATSGSQGFFNLTNLPAGSQTLDIDATGANPAPDGSPCAGFREERRLKAHVENMEDRPFFLPRIDTASEALVDPETTTMVTNASLGVELEVAPHTAKNPDGSDFTGALSISEVPRGFAPAELPDVLDPGMLVTIQPVGVTFTTPAAITFPNFDNLPPGSEVDIWSLDADSGTFQVVGVGQVTADGARIETIEGGIVATDWHFPSPGPSEPTGDTGEEQPESQQPEDEDCQPVGSVVLSKSGCLRSGVRLPRHVSLGEARGLDLVYSSNRAHPQLLLPFDVSFPSNTVIPEKVSYRVTVGGVEQVGEVFVDPAGLDAAGRTLRATAVFEAGELPSGIYPYRIRVTSRYAQSNIGSDVVGTVHVVNEQDSPFGAGWGLAGLARLERGETDDVLIIDGDGGATRFRQIPAFGAASGGAVVPIEPPASVERGALESDTEIRFFVESQNFILPEDIDADISEPGIYGSERNPVTIAGGEVVNSYLLHFDSIGGSLAGAMGSVVFGQTVLGFMVENASLEASDPVVGFPDTVYPTNSSTIDRELDATGSSPDELTLETDRQTVGIDMATTNGIDHVRVITVGAPPPLGNDFLSPPGDFTGLAEDPDTGTFTRTFRDGTRHFFDAAGRLVEVRDRNANATLYGYDAAGRLETVTDPAGRVTTLHYAGGRLERIVDPAGRESFFEHDVDGNLVQVSLPDASTRGFDYDARHLMVAETDGEGRTVTRTYDAFGRFESATLPTTPEPSVREASAAQTVGAVAPGSGTGTETNPAPFALPEEAVGTFTDGEGRVRSVVTDAFGRASAIIDPAGLVTAIERNADGLARRIEPPSGAVVRLEDYDTRGNPGTVVDEAVGGTRTLTYHPTFNGVDSVTDAFGKTTDFVYDDATGDLLQIITPVGRTTAMSYDAEGRVVSLTDVFGTESTFAYEPVHGNLETLTRGTGAGARVTGFAYTPEAGYLALVTDATGRTVTFEHDALGRVVRQTPAGQWETLFDYDGNGNIIAITPPGRPAHGFEYTEAGQVRRYRPPDVGLPEHDTEFVYNRAQQLERVMRPDGLTIDSVYDTAGRLDALVIPRGTVDLAYNSTTGLLETLATPEGATLTLGYTGDLLSSSAWAGEVVGSLERSFDAERRLRTESVNGADIIDFGYDAGGLVVAAGALALERDPAHGRVTGSTLGDVATTRAYNAFGELSEETATVAGSPLYSVTYGRDALGRITEKTETIEGSTESTVYGYDAAGRFATVAVGGLLVAEYVYDEGGAGNANRTGGFNRTEPAIDAVYDAQDRLLAYNTSSYAYTANGELESKTGPGGSTTYAYDVLGNLLGVTLPDGTGIEYLLDARNRRIGKRVDGVLEQGFLYRDPLNPVAELDAAGDVSARFVYGAKPHVPAYMVKGDVSYRIITDHLGSVRLVVNTITGAIAQRLDYDEFGQVLAASSPGFQPFGFAGGLYDPDTGLVRFGARDYDPSVGRWTTRDPLVFDASLNNYTYSNGDPMNRIDFTGEAPGSAQNPRLPPGVRDQVPKKSLSETIDPIVKDAVENAIEETGKSPQEIHPDPDSLLDMIPPTGPPIPDAVGGPKFRYLDEIKNQFRDRIMGSIDEPKLPQPSRDLDDPGPIFECPVP